MLIMNKHNSYISNSDKKNYVFGLKLVVSFALLICYFFHVSPQFNMGYDAALIDKMDRLKSIEEPKIVLIGNSNLSFGINSELLEQELNMPVVNMGLHGSAGNAFHEEMAKQNVCPGDIYIVCHSEFDDNDMLDDPVINWLALEDNFSMWKLIRPKDIKSMLWNFPIYLKKCLPLYSSGTGNQDDHGMYSRSAFNVYGDNATLRIGSAFTEIVPVRCPKVNDITSSRINELNEYLKERGASLVVAAYPIGNGNKTDDVLQFVNFQEELQNKLDCPVISNYVDYMYDYTYFYDANYLHLNTEGANIRTRQLIDDIKRWERTGDEAYIEGDGYIDIVSDANLSHIDNILEYLDALIIAKDRYAIFVSACDDYATSMSPEIIEKLHQLDISDELSCGSYAGFVSVIENGNSVYENYADEEIYTTGFVDNSMLEYTITSVTDSNGWVNSIILNGREYSKDTKGINIVVYSNETHRILDTVSFDAYEKDMSVNRE